MAINRQGIDVSYAQGEIDWARVKAAGVTFALLRCGFGDDLVEQDDSRYRQNADACTRLGIPFGLYLYSYATDTTHAASEAAHILRLARDYRPAYPLYIDLEDAGTVGQLSNTEIAAVAQTFCDRVEQAGCFVGVYADEFWWSSRLTDARFDRWAKWIAEYPTLTYPKPVGMWQYTSSGQIAGIAGSVDRNKAFVDYPAIIRDKGLNGFRKDGGGVSHPTHETPLKTGEELRLERAPLYVSARATRPETTVTGRYYVWDDVVIHGRIRITNSRETVGNAAQVTGWVNWNQTTRPVRPRTYTVRDGDTLSEIAARFSTTTAALVRLNDIKNPDLIFTGQVLTLP